MLFFHESQFSYSQLFPSLVSPHESSFIFESFSVLLVLDPSPSLPLLNSQSAAPSLSIPGSGQAADQSVFASSTTKFIPSTVSAPNSSAEIPSSAPASVSSNPVQSHMEQNLNNHPMLTRSKIDHSKPKTFLVTAKQKTVKHALSDSNWRSSMQAEYEALVKNNTWSLAKFPSHRKTIGHKWVFRIKENLNGTINKYKARLVAKGFHQQPGHDFTETSLLLSSLSAFGFC